MQICERSLSGGLSGPTMAPVAAFVRGEMFPSGYLIRPCEGGGCIIHVVDHYDNEVSYGEARNLDELLPNVLCGCGWTRSFDREVDKCMPVGGRRDTRTEQSEAFVGGHMCSLGVCRTYCGLCMSRRLCLLRSRRLRRYGT